MRIEYADMVRFKSQPLSVRSTQPGVVSGLSNVCSGHMVVLHKKPATQSTTCPAAGDTAAQVTPLLGFGPRGLEGASFSQSEPAPVPATPPPVPAADPGPTVRSLMTHLNKMVELMLAGPLAPLCREEGLELQQHFTDLALPKNKSYLGAP